MTNLLVILPDRILTSFLAAKNNLKTDKEKTGIYATLWITETHMLTKKELRTQLLTWNRILLFKKLFFFILVHSAVKGGTKWKTQQDVREKQILSMIPSPLLLIFGKSDENVGWSSAPKQILKEGMELKVGDHHCEPCFHHFKLLFKWRRKKLSCRKYLEIWREKHIISM